MKESLVSCIIAAVEKGKLKEPFDAKDVEKVCPGFAEETYKNTLVHHRKGNPINQPEYFNCVNDSGKYTVIKQSLIDCIIAAVGKGTLKEPFDTKDIEKVAPGFSEEYYRNVLVHHRKGNPI